MFLRTLLDRYIFTELLSPFSVSLGALCFVMLTRELLRLVELLVSKGVGIVAVLEVFAHLMPSFLVLTLPIAGIIASITAFGRLSFDKELVAMQAAGLSLMRLARPVLLFALLVFGLTLWLAQWGQPWSSMNLKKVALNLLRDQLVLALERGTFNEPIPKMVIYVPDGNPEQATTGIFVSDERNAEDPRIIVAQQYEVLMDASTNQVALRLQHGVIHSQPNQADQYEQTSFASYDLKLSLNQSGYATNGRSSVVRRHCRPAHAIPMARSSRPPTIDGVLQRPGLSHRLARILPSRRAGWHRLETVWTNGRICGRRVGRDCLLHTERRLRIPGHDGDPAALCRGLGTERHLLSHHRRLVLHHEPPVTPCLFSSDISFANTPKSSRCASAD